LGGVGGYTAEALARSGVGHMDLVDDDTVSLTNLNRQILATHNTVGQHKVDVARQRILDIDPTIQVRTYKTFYLPETAEQFDFSQYDYVIDAIDTVTGKLNLIAQAKAAGVPVISCMGTGNKLDATGFKVADISKTSGCALARIMRKECAKRGIKGVKVVYSEELPLTPEVDPNEPPEPQREGSSRRSLPGSTAFVPGVAGLIMAGEVIKDLSK
jgi:tRNA A37 threonylcarbamoyladenosine dehydratase